MQRCGDLKSTLVAEKNRSKAPRTDSWLKSFYNRLVETGKKKIVALTALMRTIIVIANARVRDFESATLSNI